MRFLLFLLAIMAVSGTALAQRKLKMEVYDSGDTMWSTKEKKIYVSPGSRNAVAEMLKTTAHRTSKGYMLSFYIQTGRTSVFTIEAGAGVELILANGETVRLATRTSSQSRRLVSGYGCFAYAFYSLPPDALRSLQASPVKRIMIMASMGVMEYELKEKQAKMMMEQLEEVGGE